MKEFRIDDVEVKQFDDGLIRARRIDGAHLTEKDKKLAKAITNDDVREALHIFGGFIRDVK
jgi:hypothetical protein